MNSYKIISFLTVIFSVTLVFGQQLFQFGNYTQNPYLYNPAAGGLNDFTQIDLGYRNQHISSDGNPVTMYASGSTQIYTKRNRANAATFNPDKVMMYVPPLNSVGRMKQIVGGKLFNDAIGPFQQTSALVTYGIHLPVTLKSNLGVGIGAGWDNFSMNPNKVLLLNQEDNAVHSSLGTQNQNNMDLQAGLVFYTERFTFSASATQLLANKLSIGLSTIENKLNTNWMVYSSYKWSANKDFLIEPFMMFRAVKNAPISIALGSRFQYQYVWLGAQYRTTNSFVLSAGLNLLRNFYLSYGFEYSAQSTRISTAGTHEIQIGVYLGRKSVNKAEVEQNKSRDKSDSED